MQFEEFDNKIREAAENHHPAYDEQAWARMEKLLDKHLPQKDDRKRRIIIFFFLFLLLGGAGIWLFTAKPWHGNKPVAAIKKSEPNPTREVAAPKVENTGNINEDNNNVIKDESTGAGLPESGSTKTNPSKAGQIVDLLNPAIKKEIKKDRTRETGVTKLQLKSDQKGLNIINKTGPGVKNNAKDNADKIQPDASAKITSYANAESGQLTLRKDVAAEKNPAPVMNGAKPVVNDTVNKDNSNKDLNPLAQNDPAKKKKEKSKKRNHFFLTLSSGPDFSFTGGDQLGKTKLLLGGGMGYTIKDRLTIRSGFYTARKVYTSSPGSYHPPSNFWNYYPYLIKVDADCRVYEIPLTLSYHFGHSEKQNLFVTTGLSSYLMKKETYKYYYKSTATGPTLTRQYTPRNKNNNYFSVLTLSGGYQKNIGKSFSIMAEPYIKLPLSGVGLGNVKLNSGGILISVGFKPFAGTGKHSNAHR